MPSQRELIAATSEGRDQDVRLSLRAKQRSIHNNYLTFPLLFIMLSNHFPSAFGHHLNWLVLIVVMVSGAGVRHFMNVRYAGKMWLGPGVAMASVGIVGLLAITRLNAKPAATVSAPIGFARAQEIMVQRCLPCHSAHPTDPLFPAAPTNVIFDTPERIAAMAARIKERAVVSRTMPFLNRTNMTETERAELGDWLDHGAELK